MRYIINSVNRSGEFERIVQLLGASETRTGDTKLFGTLRDVLSFAAVLGYREGQKRPFSSKHGQEDIQASVYQRNEANEIIFAIALGDKKDANILKPENERECIKIFEEYANGGLHIISGWLDKHANIDADDAIMRGLKSIGLTPETIKKVKPMNEPEF